MRANSADEQMQGRPPVNSISELVTEEMKHATALPEHKGARTPGNAPYFLDPWANILKSHYTSFLRT